MKHPRYILEGIIRCFRKHGQPYDEATLIRGLYKQQMKLMAIEIGGWPALRRMERTLA
jgi:hypothetical protein